MPISLRILLIAVALISSGSMLRKIRKSKLQIEYTLFWVIFSVLLILMAIFPGVVQVVANWFGIYSPANLVFAAIIFILLVKVFLMTVELSNLEVKLKELAQKFALDHESVENDNIVSGENDKTV